MSRQSSERRYTSARERATKQSTGFTSPYLKLPEGTTFFKPKTGGMLLDILPFEAGKGNPWAEEGNLHWERTIYVHRGIGANGDSYLCPRMTSKHRCPICEFRAKLMKETDGDEEKEQQVKDLAPKQRQLLNVVNLKDPDKKIQVWDVSYHLFGKFLDARLRNSEEEDEWGKFFFLEDGLSLRVGFADKSFGGHTFQEVESIDFKQRREDYDEEILEKVVALDDAVVEHEYDKLKKVFLETGDDEDEPVKKKAPVDEDEDEPAPKKKRVVEEDEDEPVRKKPVIDEDEDEPVRKKRVVEEDEDEPAPKKKRVVDEDEDEPAPRKKAVVEEDEDELPPKKKRVVEEDEDEERPHIKTKKEIDAEDEDEPAPKKKKAPADTEDDWDDFDDTPKKKKAVVEEDEDEPAPKKKK